MTSKQRAKGQDKAAHQEQRTTSCPGTRRCSQAPPNRTPQAELQPIDRLALGQLHPRITRSEAKAPRATRRRSGKPRAAHLLECRRRCPPCPCPDDAIEGVDQQAIIAKTALRPRENGRHGLPRGGIAQACLRPLNTERGRHHRAAQSRAALNLVALGLVGVATRHNTALANPSCILVPPRPWEAPSPRTLDQKQGAVSNQAT